MNLNIINQCDSLECMGNFDLVIAASGYESRARHIAERNATQFGSKVKKVVFSFKEHRDDCARRTNDDVFRKLGYDEVLQSGKADAELIKVISSYTQLLRGREAIRVLVDISSMTRSWYGAIVKWLAQLTPGQKFEVIFAYSTANFVEPMPSYPPNRVVGPVPGFTGNALPNLPTALIIGLGYDRDRALGLQHYLDPQLTNVFAANPCQDPRFIAKVEKVNLELLSHLTEEQKFFYPVNDWVSTFKLLESVSNGLRKNWRVVMCSLGPKTFGLACFLAASIHRELSIWRVSADHHEHARDHKPTGTVLLLTTSWS